MMTELPPDVQEIRSDSKVMTTEIMQFSKFKFWCNATMHTFCQFCIKWKVTILAWITLLMSIVSGSAIGPMFKYMEVQGVPALVGMFVNNLMIS